jgi:predicted transport protein
MREAFVRQMIGPKEIYKFLSDLASQPLKIIIIIEHKDAKVVEACEGLRISPKILQFKSFEREGAENVKAHLIEPLFGIGEITEKGKEGGKSKLPPHYKDWHSMLAWVDDNVKDILALLRRHVVEIGEVNRVVHGRYLCFYIGEPSTKTIFAAFLLTKKALKIRIRTQADKFEDRKKWTGDKVYKGWFFKKGQEREFRITGEEQIEYAMELINQAYWQTKRIAKIDNFLRKHKK